MKREKLIEQLKNVHALEIEKKWVLENDPELNEIFNCDYEYMRYLFNSDEIRYLPDGEEPFPLKFDKWEDIPTEDLKKYYKEVKKMKKKELEGSNFRMSSNELKEIGEIGENIYFWMIKRLEDWANKETNNTTFSDLDSFKKGYWIIELYIRENGLSYSAGRTQQEINNQNEWGQDSWEDISFQEFKKEFKEYLI